jgi:hypothetical protein
VTAAANSVTSTKKAYSEYTFLRLVPCRVTDGILRGKGKTRKEDIQHVQKFPYLGSFFNRANAWNVFRGVWNKKKTTQTRFI